METIAERLSTQENLYFPQAILSNTKDPCQRKAVLLDLLSRDVALFLERYGSLLTSDELHEFDALKEDYEINWHLKRLRSIMSPTLQELKSKSVAVKNRRRAYLNKLIHDGQYFSEDAMREREPYLHHEYVGKYQDPSGRSMARPGERWSETLMRRSEEAFLVAKIRREQQRLGVAERDWIGNDRNQGEEKEEEMEEEEEEEEEEEGEEEEEEEEEEDEDEEEEEEGEEEPKRANDTTHGAEMVLDNPEATDGANTTTVRQSEEATLSMAEIQDQMEQFTNIMQQKFLLGEDYDYLDYSKIDNDETLDDHWQREANHDAEEKYFSED